MCWNSQVSMNTFIFSMFGILFALYNKYSPFAILLLFSFIIMQLIEFGIWKSIYMKSKYYNNLLSICSLIAILFQPVASILLLYPINQQLMFIFLSVYLFIVGYVLIFSKSKAKSIYSYVGKNGHLVWSWALKQNINIVLFIAYFTFFFTPLILSKNYLLFLICLVTLIFSLYFFYRYDTWTTMWCWIANILVLILIAKILFIDVI